MTALADVVKQGKALYIGVSEWTADQIREGHRLATEMGVQLISSQPQYSMLWRVIEERGHPDHREQLGVQPDRLVADRPGRPVGQARPWRAAAPRAPARPTSTAAPA